MQGANSILHTDVNLLIFLDRREEYDQSYDRGSGYRVTISKDVIETRLILAL